MRHIEFSSHGVIPRKQARAYGNVYGKFATAEEAANELKARGYTLSEAMIGYWVTVFAWLTDDERKAASAAVVAPAGPGKPYGIAFCL